MRTPSTCLLFASAVLCAQSVSGQSVYFSTSQESSFQAVSAANGASATRFITGLLSVDFALSPDGTRAYVANAIEGGVAAISLSSGRRIANFMSPAQAGPFAVALSPDGSKLYSAYESILSVIDVATGATLQTVQIGDFLFFNPGFSSMAVTPNGNKAYLSGGNLLLVFDLVTASLIGAVDVPQPRRLALSPAGDRLYAVSTDDQALVYIVDTATRSVVNMVPKGQQSASDVAVSADGSTLYIATSNGMTLASASTGQITANIPSASLSRVALSSDGKAACAIPKNTSNLARFDLVTKSLAGLSPVHGFGNKCAYSSDGTRIFDLLAPDDNVTAFSTVNQKVTRSIPFAAGSAAVISADGKTLVEPVSNGLKVIDTQSKKQVRTISYELTNGSVAVSNDGTVAFVTTGSGPIDIAELDLTSGNLIRTIALSAAGTELFLALSPDGLTLYALAGRASPNLCAVDVVTASVRACQPLAGNPFGSFSLTRPLTVSADGTRVYLIVSPHSVGEFDAATLTLQRSVVVAGQNSSGSSVLFSPAANSLYVIAEFEGASGFVARVDPATFTIAAQQILPFNPFDIAVSVDGASVYLAAGAKNIPILDAETLALKSTTPAGDFTASVVAGPY